MRRPLLFLLALGAIAVLAVGCSGKSSNRGRLSLGTSTDTSSSSNSDSALSDFSDDTSLGNFFGDTGDTGSTGDSSDSSSPLLGGTDLRKIFVSSCENGGGTTTLCECVADKLDFNDPKNIGKNAIKAARECAKGQ